MQAWDVDLLTAVYVIKTGHYPERRCRPSSPTGPRSDGRTVEVGRFEHLRDDFLRSWSSTRYPRRRSSSRRSGLHRPGTAADAAPTRTTTTTSCANWSRTTPGT